MVVSRVFENLFGANNLNIFLPGVDSKKECNMGNWINKIKFESILYGYLTVPKDTEKPLYKTKNIHDPATKKIIWQVKP